MKGSICLVVEAANDRQITAQELAAIVARHFDHFAILPVEQWTNGKQRPGWRITIYTNYLPQVVELTLRLQNLRSEVSVWVGIELAGSYVQCSTSDASKGLLSALRSALPTSSPFRKKAKPGPWVEVSEHSRDEPGIREKWQVYVRILSEEHFGWGKNNGEDVEQIDSGSACFIASYLLEDEEATIEDLEKVTVIHPELIPLLAAMRVLQG